LVNDDQVLDLARRVGVAVYPISLRSELAAPAFREVSLATFFMTRISADTGGQVSFPRALRDLEGVYLRIGEELRAQYSLGYVSSNQRRDGKWRSVSV